MSRYYVINLEEGGGGPLTLWTFWIELRNAIECKNLLRPPHEFQLFGLAAVNRTLQSGEFSFSPEKHNIRDYSSALNRT